jgi:hypothetical protein
MPAKPCTTGFAGFFIAGNQGWRPFSRKKSVIFIEMGLPGTSEGVLN